MAGGVAVGALEKTENPENQRFRIFLYLKNKHNKNPLMVAADLQRPAAIEQLVTLGKGIDVEVYSDLKSKDPIKVVGDAMKKAKKSSHDIILIEKPSLRAFGRLYFYLRTLNTKDVMIDLS